MGDFKLVSLFLGPDEKFELSILGSWRTEDRLPLYGSTVNARFPSQG